MQKIATQIFIYASLIFGITGILLVFFTGTNGDNGEPNTTLLKILFSSVFIILPSFALSVASKYLRNKE